MSPVLAGKESAFHLRGRRAAGRKSPAEFETELRHSTSPSTYGNVQLSPNWMRLNTGVLSTG
jgi:hypothetical protein